VRQRIEALMHRVCTGPLLTKTVRVFISGGFRNRIKCKQMQCLHGSIDHCGDSQRKLHMNAVSLWVGLKSSILSIRSAAKVSRF
jgi:hypothetical protein